MNKKNRKKLIFINTLMILLVNLFLLSDAFGWFVTVIPELDVSTISGHLLTNYFDSGTGKEDDPFIITRPIHYYNLVHLYQRVDDYSNSDYYFQVGKEKVKNSGEFFVYEYDEHGNEVNKDLNSKTLNLAYYNNSENALLPIGTHDKNFKGHFNGNNLTISNYTITTLPDEKDCDIGIFGFVAENAEIYDIYYSNVTIDLQNISSEGSLVTSITSGQTHNADAHKISENNYIAYVGYIAGHVISNAQFSKVYINNVSVIGGGPTTAATSKFGYFGCIENNDGSLVETLYDTLTVPENNGIAFEQMYSFLESNRDNANTVVAPFQVSKKIWKHQFNDPTKQDIIKEFDQVDSNFINVIRKNESLHPNSSLSFSKYSENDEGNTIYLTGQTTMNQNVTTVEVEKNTTGFVFHSQTQNTYLQIDKDTEGFKTTENVNNATVWTCDNSVSTNKGYYYATEIDDNNCTCTKYYITDSGISTDVNKAKIWEFSDDRLFHDTGTGILYLSFNGEGLGAPGGEPDYVISSIYNDVTYYVQVIKDDSGYKSNTVTLKSSASVLQQDNDGYWYTIVNSVNVYIRNKDSKLDYSTGTYKTNCAYYNNNWYFDGKNKIKYDGSSWMTETSYVTEFFIYRQVTSDAYGAQKGFYFLSANSSASIFTTNIKGNSLSVPAGSSVWNIEALDPNNPLIGKLYTKIGSTKYYVTVNLELKRTINSNKFYAPISLTNIASNALEINFTSNNYWTATVNGISNCYLCFNSWDETYCFYQGQSYNGTTNNIKYYLQSSLKKTYPLQGGDGDDSGEAISATEGNIYKTDGFDFLDVKTTETIEDILFPINTWFPIICNNSGVADSANFGYVVSGMENKNDNLYKSGDISVTKNNINQISSSMDANGLTNVCSINGSGTSISLINSFKVYNSCSATFYEMIKNKSFIYGLNFLGGSVDKDDAVEIPYVSLFDVSYSDYSIPRHCIDLYAKKKSYITIFASNVSNNTNFFSLYHIERDENNNIIEARKIKEIYNVDDELHYVYYGESSSYNINNKVFDYTWLVNKNLSSYPSNLFYFEIPINKGEYALSSTDNDSTNNASILYIDLAEEDDGLFSEDSLIYSHFLVDFRSTGYVESSYYVEHSLFYYSFDAPGTSSDNFTINTEFVTDDLPFEGCIGLYIINITSKTTIPIDLTVLLCDNDDISGNFYPYAYRIIYTNNSVTNQTYMNDSLDYFKKSENIHIE